MKKIFSIIIAVFSALLLCSCGESVNMAMLTEYQNGGFLAELKISAKGKEYRAELEKSGERLFLSVKEPARLEAFTFIFSESGVFLEADGAEIPFSAHELFSLADIYALFSVPVAGTWKIEKARPGGVATYICNNGSALLYIDANSRLPLKIACGKTVADVLSFKITERAK